MIPGSGRGKFHDEVEVHRGANRILLKHADEETAVSEVCRKAGISDATFCNWRKRYGSILTSEVKKLRQLEEENTKLKRMIADVSRDKEMLQDVSRAPDGIRSWNVKPFGRRQR